MIDLYTSTSPSPQKAWLMLEELGVAYRAHKVDVFRGGQFTAEFTRLNPNRKVPVIVDQEGPDGKPYALFESGAILIYLAEKHGRFLPASGAARYDALKWMMIQMASVGPMLGQYNHFRRYAPEGNGYGLSRYGSEAVRLYELLEGRLGEAEYLGGEAYTVADIAMYPWIRAMSRLYASDGGFAAAHNPDYPNLWRWCDVIAERPAVQRLVEALETMPSTIASATPDELDRVFQRGRYARA